MSTYVLVPLPRWLVPTALTRAQMSYMQLQAMLQECLSGPASLQRESGVPAAIVMAGSGDVRSHVQAVVLQGSGLAHMIIYSQIMTEQHGPAAACYSEHPPAGSCLLHARCSGLVHTPAAPRRSCCLYGTNASAVRQVGLSL